MHQLLRTAPSMSSRMFRCWRCRSDCRAFCSSTRDRACFQHSTAADVGVLAARSAATLPSVRAVPLPRGMQHESRRMQSSTGATREASDAYFPVAVALGMGGILFGVSKLSNTTLFEPREHDTVWFGNRGVFSSERACAILPITACAASGLFAAGIAHFFPVHAAWVELPSKPHELLAFPLAILVAFRFDKSYERWWFARSEVESMSSCILSLAVHATSELPKDNQEEAKRNIDQFFSRLVALCDLISLKLKHCAEPCAFVAPESLSPEDVACCSEASDSVFWCMKAIVHCIAEGQRLEQFSGELAAQMYSTMDSLQNSYRTCTMLETQKSPAPFVVHMRSLLLFWCFTFPFTIIKNVRQ
eukprot:TRINITY_DN4373_c0_g1_i1.p1 TRINITY_DN4373_c0_g1~~TRINITY_DN4373_c0_g1_i1.p1  ORF type:complete len:360 (+),score=41.29 TRINITY_DN4373_c0_g1_i1:90-1169(+)